MASSSCSNINKTPINMSQLNISKSQKYSVIINSETKKPLFRYTETTQNFDASYCPRGQGISYRDGVILSEIRGARVMDHSKLRTNPNLHGKWPEYVLKPGTECEDIIIFHGTNMILFVLDDDEPKEIVYGS